MTQTVSAAPSKGTKLNDSPKSGTIALTPDLNFAVLSRTIAKYLDTLGDTDAAACVDEAAAQCALEDLFRDQIDVEANSDAVFIPSRALGYGVRFGIEATLAALKQPPPELLDTLINLCDTLRERLREDYKVFHPSEEGR